ncbi:MAG: tetratricopeptide repeat protein, partial [Planctomycetes bacterium]|nr:tetratricopeptide repeat protein [Planctomycetota bacterium]
LCLARSARTAQIAQEFGSGKLMPLRELLTMDHKAWNGSANPVLNYSTAFSFVNYLINTQKGLKNFNIVLNALRGGEDISRKLPASRIQVFEEEWKEDLKTRFVPYSKTLLYTLPGTSWYSEKSAKSLLDQAVKDYPELADAWYLRGRSRRREKDYAGCIADMNQTAVLDPAWPGLSRWLGLAAFGAGDLKEAKKQLAEALRSGSDPEIRDTLKLIQKQISESR